MKLTSSLIFVVLVASLIGGFHAETTPTVNPTTETTTLSSQSTTVADTTPQPDTTTTSPSTTTNLPTTSSTELPTTTSTITTTTAKQTTTSPPDTTTTTSTPKPTTVPPSTTTKSPEPPTPDEGSWNVTNDNLTCIRADLKIRFKIPVKDSFEYTTLSPNATSTGNCQLSNTTQEIELKESDFTLTMIFEKDANNAYLKNITFSYTLPEVSGNVYNDTKLFSVKLGNSYMCESLADVNLKGVTMEIMKIHIQAFGNLGNNGFGTAEDCEADHKVNDMVPIAVGIALLVLVVVVLIAYFVGRRRSRQKGYQSV